jgi:hypothetical protein
MITEPLELEDEGFSDLLEIPIHFMAEILARVPNPHYSEMNAILRARGPGLFAPPRMLGTQKRQG